MHATHSRLAVGTYHGLLFYRRIDLTEFVCKQGECASLDQESCVDGVCREDIGQQAVGLTEL